MYNYGRGVGLQLLTHSSNLLKMPAWKVGYRSRSFRKEVIDLKNVASTQGVCSLSANQIGCSSSFFVVLNRRKLVVDKWAGYKAGPSDYEVVVNPNIEKRSEDTVTGREECPSLPGFEFTVTRFAVVRVIWKNETMIDQSSELTGFDSRVWQHEIDHLNGSILIDAKVCKGHLAVKPGAKDFTNGNFELSRLAYIKHMDEHPDDKAELHRRWTQLVQLAKYGIIEPNAE